MRWFERYKTVRFVDENTRQELVGPRSYRGNKIQNGRHVNKGKMQRITISSDPEGRIEESLVMARFTNGKNHGYENLFSRIAKVSK